MPTETLRMQAYDLEELKPGDRFYFASDRKKKVYTLSFKNAFEIKEQKQFHIKYANCLDHWNRPEQHKASRRVIFLRHITPHE